MNLYDSRILLIDDNIELADMVRDMLRRNGYVNVSCSHTCEQGMRMFREEQSQLVILDIMLPDGDGFTLFRKIRDISDVPILFLSAKDEDNDRLFGLGLGADDYITKPFLSQELLLRVNAVLKRTYFSSARMSGDSLTFDALCMAVWGDSYYGYENTLMVHIRHLREKIEDDPSSPKWLLTARGLGYRLKKEEKTENEKPV